MANANTNLLSISTANRQTNLNATSRTQNSVSSRTNTTKPSATSTRKSKGNFSSELDKANAQANQAQQSDEAQVAAESAESTPVDELAQSSSHGKKSDTQDAPKQKEQNLPNEENVSAATKTTAENLVTEIISSDIVPKTKIESPVDIPQDIPKSLDAEIIGETIPPQVTIQPAFHPFKNLPAESKVNVSDINLNELPAQNLDSNVENENLNVAENLPAQAISADMAFYFVSSNESLLTPKDIPAEVDTTNLMSIMPQTRDNKAQSMLDFLSGKTWQSVQSEEDVPQTQNLNLQNLFPQSEQSSAVQPVQIQPQYQPRVIDIQSVVQPTLQAQTVLPNQETVQMQMPTDLQPVTTNQASVQVQNDLQPVMMNQPTLQPQPQIDLQPVVMSQPTLQPQPQNDFQPVVMNQPTLQPQLQTDLQPVMMNQPTLQPQLQTDLQPVIMNQPTLQSQPQTDLQPVMMNQPTLQPQPQTDLQPVMMNQPTLQPQPQTDLQPVMMNQPTLQAQPQTDLQPVMMNQPTLQAQPQNDLQPVVMNQPTVQAQPQFQQQQFGSEIQPQVNSLQSQIDSKTVNRQFVEDMFGVNVQVEDTRPATEPLMPLQNFSRQFNQNQQSAQNFQQNFAPMTAQVETQVAEQVPQGAENFAGNIAALNNTQSQPTVQVQSPEVMQAPREDFNIPTQIVEQARMIRTNTNTEMVINLKPEHLGELTLRVSVGTNGAVTASFYSDNAQVRAIIENSIVHLRQELNEQGIKVDNVEVYAGLNEDSLLNGQGQQAWQQNQQQRNQHAPVDYEVAEEEIETLNTVTDNLSADGVDYKV